MFEEQWLGRHANILRSSYCPCARCLIAKVRTHWAAREVIPRETGTSSTAVEHPEHIYMYMVVLEWGGSDLGCGRTEQGLILVVMEKLAKSLAQMQCGCNHNNSSQRTFFFKTGFPHEQLFRAEAFLKIQHLSQANKARGVEEKLTFCHRASRDAREEQAATNQQFPTWPWCKSWELIPSTKRWGSAQISCETGENKHSE